MKNKIHETRLHRNPSCRGIIAPSGHSSCFSGIMWVFSNDPVTDDMGRQRSTVGTDIDGNDTSSLSYKWKCKCNGASRQQVIEPARFQGRGDPVETYEYKISRPYPV
jgi:hypothetical protein